MSNGEQLNFCEVCFATNEAEIAAILQEVERRLSERESANGPRIEMPVDPPALVSVPIEAATPIKAPSPSGLFAPDIPVSDDDEQPDAPDNLVRFPGPAKAKRGRPAKSRADSYRVSVEKVSLNTYAVRVRWKRADGTDDPGIVINRLNDSIVQEIKRSKKRYEQFKSQTLSNWQQSATVRQGLDPGANPRRLV